MQILVADDDQITREMIAYALNKDGHEIVTACNGSEALEVLAQNMCRVVITDYLMPGVNGRTLCRSIRNGEFGSYVYIILISGSRMEQSDVIAGFSAGADDFLTKPLDLAELRMRIGAAARILGLETRDAT